MKTSLLLFVLTVVLQAFTVWKLTGQKHGYRRCFQFIRKSTGNSSNNNNSIGCPLLAIFIAVFFVELRSFLY
jgi:hypothetical protein